MKVGFQGPTTGGTAESYGELFGIVTHPAFRLGFLDAQHGKPIDHDRIADRVYFETPASALARLSFDPNISSAAFELAQYRYEEGRLCVTDIGLRCRAWGHPDFPPIQVRQYISERARHHRSPAVVDRMTAVDGLRTPSALGPLFDPDLMAANAAPAFHDIPF